MSKLETLIKLKTINSIDVFDQSKSEVYFYKPTHVVSGFTLFAHSKPYLKYDVLGYSRYTLGEILSHNNMYVVDQITNKIYVKPHLELHTSECKFYIYKDTIEEIHRLKAKIVDEASYIQDSAFEYRAKTFLVINELTGEVTFI